MIGASWAIVLITQSWLRQSCFMLGLLQSFIDDLKDPAQIIENFRNSI